jgi:glycogen(starch) synthase
MIVPSRWPEPFGLVALQAAQMGRPVIAAASGGLKDVVANGETGWLVPPEDAATLADRMAWLLANPGDARRIGATARRRAIEQFGFDAFLDAYEGAFVEAIDRARQRAAA